MAAHCFQCSLGCTWECMRYCRGKMDRLRKKERKTKEVEQKVFSTQTAELRKILVLLPRIIKPNSTCAIFQAWEQVKFHGPVCELGTRAERASKGRELPPSVSAVLWEPLRPSLFLPEPGAAAPPTGWSSPVGWWELQMYTCCICQCTCKGFKWEKLDSCIEREFSS